MKHERQKLLRVRRRLSRIPEWDGTFPEGRKRGVKRDTKVAIGDRCPSITKADEYSPVDEDRWEEYAKHSSQIEKRDRVQWILDQDGVGSCAAESATQSLACGISYQLGYDPPVFNPWFNYQLTSGGSDNGSVIGDNVEDLVKRGACPEEIRPRSRGWRAAPTATELRIAKLFRLRSYFHVDNIAEFVSALLRGFCIHFGYSGHAVESVSYLGSGKILYANSWGESWGDHGFGMLSVDKIYFPYGAYAYSVVRPWDRDVWVPTMDQATLARAVPIYMFAMKEVHQPWADRQQSVRTDYYDRTLKAVGLARQSA